MHFNRHLALIITLCCFVFAATAMAQDTKADRQVEVAIRTIGHEVMMAHGDSTSRVLPVQQDGDQYIIQFDTEFQFVSTKLITAVDSVVKRTDLANHYLVEMRDDATQETIYSYEVDGILDLLTIPCGTREQPEASYSLLFTIMDDDMASLAPITTMKIRSRELATTGESSLMYIAIPIFFLIGIAIYRNRDKALPTPYGQVDNPNIISIGDYTFDKRNMMLSLADNNVELTSKESDLLDLLQSSANTTIEREAILSHVWGDKGDYVGRTLDVFISKLRKKLEGDPAVKIANIRGVGYRLVVQD